MELALTEPDLGYYATSELRPTRGGDFLTAPELHPFFGRCLGRFVAAAWQRAGCPASFRVREDGAGRGTLRDDVMAGLRQDAPVLAELISWQALDLPGRGDEPAAGQADVVLANELLDALPVHRVMEDAGLRELWVGWRDGWFGDVPGEPSTPRLAEHLAADGVTLRPGQRAEIGLAAAEWMARAAADAAIVLVIDYGHEAAELYGPRRMAGTLLTYRRQRVSDDPFTAVGRTDISAHVDLTAIDRAARSAGLELLGSTSQARFLTGLGLGELLAELGRAAGTGLDEYAAARAAVARMLDPRHLGGFRVMAWGHADRGDQAREAGVDRGRPGASSLPSVDLGRPGASSLPGFDGDA